jgi:hypothetical protein
MQFPDIHMNGTPDERLMEGYMLALERCQEALQALRQVEVNGRDYYRLPGDAGSVAMAEHRARLAALEGIVSDLSAIAEHIDEHTPA